MKVGKIHWELHFSISEDKIFSRYIRIGKKKVLEFSSGSGAIWGKKILKILSSNGTISKRDLL